MKKSVILLILFFSSSFILFFAKGYFLLDSDFGWHLRMGQVILKSGIPKTDPFSYTMPSYPFVDHEWLTNVAIAELYPVIGQTGMSILFALLVISALILACRFLKDNGGMFFLLAASVIAPFAGVRTQVITWVFYSILLLIIFEKPGSKYKYILPILFLFWVNLHGGFALGIISLLVVYIARIIFNQKIDYKDAVILILSITATFINPYGYRIWWEVWMQISDQTLRWTISEWMPALFDAQSVSLMLFISISVADSIIFFKEIEKSELVLYSGLFIAGQTSQRHIPLWVISALPMLNSGFANLKRKANKFIHGAKRFAVLEKFGGLFLLLVIALQTGLFIKNLKDSIQTLAYPVGAVRYLQAQKPKGNIFSVYNWGGYLDLNLPEKKVFIDGRMPSWRWKSPNSQESNYAFLDYLKLGNGSLPVSFIINKYNILVFLLPVNHSNSKQTGNWIYNILRFNKTILGNQSSQKINLEIEIKRLGFKQIYIDNSATIWEKK